MPSHIPRRDGFIHSFVDLHGGESVLGFMRNSELLQSPPEDVDLVPGICSSTMYWYSSISLERRHTIAVAATGSTNLLLLCVPRNNNSSGEMNSRRSAVVSEEWVCICILAMCTSTSSNIATTVSSKASCVPPQKMRKTFNTTKLTAAVVVSQCGFYACMQR